MPPVSTTYYPSETPVVTVPGGYITPPWDLFFSALSTLALTVNAIPGQNLFTLAGQPSLGASDAGYVGYVTDFAHFVRWTGAAWDWLDGDRPGKVEDYAFDPGTGYQLCDGTVTTYLKVGGATLTTGAYPTLNMTGTASYRKSGAAYSGAIAAASGTTGTGGTGTGTTGTGTTGTGTTDVPASGIAIAHTTTPVIVDNNGGGSTVTISGRTSGNVIDDGVQVHGVPGLSVPGLSVPSLSVPALAVGTIDMARSSWLPYFRR